MLQKELVDLRIREHCKQKENISSTNHPLADRYIDYIVDKFEEIGAWPGGPHVSRGVLQVNNLNRPVCGYMETVPVNRLADRQTDRRPNTLPSCNVVGSREKNRK